MNTRRAAFTTLGALALLTSTYLFFFISNELTIMPSQQQGGSSQSPDDLKIVLNTAASPGSVKVTVRNDSPSITYTALVWGTPFDDVNPFNTGALRLRDATTGAGIDGPGLMVNRLLPPPRDALVELLPGGESTTTVSLDMPWIPKKNVKVEARGHWKAVWATGKSQVDDEALAAMSGPGCLQGDFFNEGLVVQMQ